MDTKPLFVASWFGAAITTLVFALLLLVYLSRAQVVKYSNQSFKLYAALPQDIPQQKVSVNLADARPKIIEDFFKKYSSPLSSYSKNFVSTADIYNLDWRLLPAISMQESNGGRKVIKNSHNPFGYGIYGNLVVRFDSWEEAIDRVGKALRNDYLNAGLNSPKQIMTKYTPPSLAKGGTWARGVTSFMEELR
ncbi:MAG: hypothetical protein AAB414_00845 [Patescibacteria group bacterium]